MPGVFGCGPQYQLRGTRPSATSESVRFQVTSKAGCANSGNCCAPAPTRVSADRPRLATAARLNKTRGCGFIGEFLLSGYGSKAPGRCTAAQALLPSTNYAYRSRAVPVNRHATRDRSARDPMVYPCNEC